MTTDYQTIYRKRNETVGAMRTYLEVVLGELLLNLEVEGFPRSVAATYIDRATQAVLADLRIDVTGGRDGE